MILINYWLDLPLFCSGAVEIKTDLHVVYATWFKEYIVTNLAHLYLRLFDTFKILTSVTECVNFVDKGYQTAGPEIFNGTS